MHAMKKVFVGLSGGVDSAVSAALLQREGYDVTGVFIKIWQPEFTECTWQEDRLDAMRVAAYLKIPFKEIDLSEEYKNEVVSEMISSYQRGITPNPDVRCNEKIKFGHFLRYALAAGADYVATGHYARIETSGDIRRLMRGIDTDKDQSYFLYRLGQHELMHTLFPVGTLKKTEVRALATEFGLPVASKHDSQGLCFVGPVTIPEFLSRYIALETGSVLDVSGDVVGSHDGAALFTTGQRHGFRMHTPPPHPLYVVAIDARNNTITVSSDPVEAAVLETRLEDIHFSVKPHDGAQLFAQSRYRETAVAVTLNESLVTFESAHMVTPGQSVVLYDDEVCIGGGIAVGMHTHA